MLETQGSASLSYSAEQISAALPYLNEREQAELADALEQAEADEIDRRCLADPLHWAQNHTRTENPHYEKMGLPFREPFPKKSYFVPLFEAFKQYQFLFIPKSRDMMTSWSGMVWATYLAQWRGAFSIVQTMKEEKARELVDYAACLYRNQDRCLQDKYPLEGASLSDIRWKNGGRVLGVPAGIHQVRTYHPTLYIIDEAAFLPEAQACYNAVRASGSHVQILAISSAGPSWFGDVCSR